jgi:hypothetical protein
MTYRDPTDPQCNLVGTLGNHEFDEGKDEILRLLDGGNHFTGPFLEDPYRGAKFPYVCANAVRTADRKPLIDPYVIEIGGVRLLNPLTRILLPSQTVRVIRHRGRPVREYTENPHVFGEDVEHLHHVTRLMDDGTHRLIVIATTIREEPRTFDGPRDDMQTSRTGIRHILGGHDLVPP